MKFDSRLLAEDRSNATKDSDTVEALTLILQMNTCLKRVTCALQLA